MHNPPHPTNKNKQERKTTLKTGTPFDWCHEKIIIIKKRYSLIPA